MAKVQLIHEKLKAYYTDKVEIPDRNALDELVYNMLLVGASRDRAIEAFKALKEDFHDWNEVRVSMPFSIERAIKGVGSENLKALRIVKILQSVYEDRSEVDLDFLEEMTPAAIKNYLGGMDGVGNTIIESVLVMAVKQHFFPVTKSVLRFALRYGLISSLSKSKDLKEMVERDIPVGEMSIFVTLLDYHNESTCRFDKPKCTSCALKANCETGKASKTKREAQFQAEAEAGEALRDSTMPDDDLDEGLVTTAPDKKKAKRQIMKVGLISDVRLRKDMPKPVLKPAVSLTAEAIGDAEQPTKPKRKTKKTEATDEPKTEPIKQLPSPIAEMQPEPQQEKPKRKAKDIEKKAEPVIPKTEAATPVISEATKTETIAEDKPKRRTKKAEALTESKPEVVLKPEPVSSKIEEKVDAALVEEKPKRKSKSEAKKEEPKVIPKPTETDTTAVPPVKTEPAKAEPVKEEKPKRKSKKEEANTRIKADETKPEPIKQTPLVSALSEPVPQQQIQKRKTKSEMKRAVAEIEPEIAKPKPVVAVVTEVINSESLTEEKPKRRTKKADASTESKPEVVLKPEPVVTKVEEKTDAVLVEEKPKRKSKSEAKKEEPKVIAKPIEPDTKAITPEKTEPAKTEPLMDEKPKRKSKKQDASAETEAVISEPKLESKPVVAPVSAKPEQEIAQEKPKRKAKGDALKAESEAKPQDLKPETLASPLPSKNSKETGKRAYTKRKPKVEPNIAEKPTKAEKQSIAKPVEPVIDNTPEVAQQPKKPKRMTVKGDKKDADATMPVTGKLNAKLDKLAVNSKSVQASEGKSSKKEGTAERPSKKAAELEQKAKKTLAKSAKQAEVAAPDKPKRRGRKDT